MNTGTLPSSENSFVRPSLNKPYESALTKPNRIPCKIASRDHDTPVIFQINATVNSRYKQAR